MASAGAIILAAGAASRFGSPKQIAIFEGETLVRRSVITARMAGCSPVIVVAGLCLREILRALDGAEATVVENVRWQTGMGSSIKAGMEAMIHAAPEAGAVLLMTCDQPLITAEMLRSVLVAGTPEQIVASSYADTLGVPAKFPACHWNLLLNLPDGQGAKTLLSSHAESVAAVSVPEGAFDIDCPEDLQRWMPAIPS